jgi:hypothetical protein
MKVGDLVRCIYDKQLALITAIPRTGVVHVLRAGGNNHGKTMTAHSSLMEIINESR